MSAAWWWPLCCCACSPALRCGCRIWSWEPRCDTAGSAAVHPARPPFGRVRRRAGRSRTRAGIRRRRMANTLYDGLFGRNAGRDAAFILRPRGETISHAAFMSSAARIAHVLAGAGLAPGDRLMAQVPKSPEALALYAACVQAGVVFLPLNTGYTVEELRYFAGDSGAAMLVCDPSRADALAPVAEAEGARLMTLDAAGGGTLCAAMDGQPDVFDTVERGPDDLAALLYTSGTTGRSKGAMLSHGNLLSNARTLAEIWRFTAEDVLLHALPIFHTHGLFVATNVTLVAGGAMILLPKFDAG